VDGTLVVSQTVKVGIAPLKFLYSTGKVGHDFGIGHESFIRCRLVGKGETNLGSFDGRQQFVNHLSHQVGLFRTRLTNRLTLLGGTQKHIGANPTDWSDQESVSEVEKRNKAKTQA
jgi:hypothetical protein